MVKRTALLFLTGVLFLFLTGASVKLFGRGDTVIGQDPMGVVKARTVIFMEGKIMFNEIIELAKSIQWEYRAAVDEALTAVICQGPGILFHASLVSDQGGEVDGIIYDGTSTAGTIMFDMAAVNKASDHLDLWPGRYFKKGLYIVGVAHVESMTVGFLPIKD